MSSVAHAQLAELLTGQLVQRKALLDGRGIQWARPEQ